MTLTIDSREKRPHPAATKRWLDNHGVPADVATLTVGDFQFKDANDGLVLVTRKSEDLFDSLYSKHLADEVRACVQAVKDYGSGSVWFLLDGIFVPTFTDKNRSNIGVYTTTGNSEWLHLKTERTGQPNLIPGVLASLQAAGVSVLTTQHVPSALKLLYDRAQEVDKVGNWPSGFGRGVKKAVPKWSTKQGKIAHLMTLWPRLTERTANALMEEFGSIAAIVAAPPDVLLEVKGVGKQGVKNFKEIVG